MANRTLTSADAIVGAMLLDAQGSAMSIMLVAKDVLAARWLVWLTIMCQIVGLTVVLELNRLPAPGCQKKVSANLFYDLGVHKMKGSWLSQAKPPRLLAPLCRPIQIGIRRRNYNSGCHSPCGLLSEEEFDGGRHLAAAGRRPRAPGEEERSGKTLMTMGMSRCRRREFE
jgi:hypothetical protein